MIWTAFISTVKIPPETDLFDPASPRLIEVIASDFPLLVDYSKVLWRAAYEPHLFSSDISERLWARSYSRPALEAAHVGGEKTFWVMMSGGRAGFVAYRLETASRRMRLSKLYLHPDHWGRGLGSWVLRSITNAALDGGALCIDLYVFRQNTRAIQAYQRAGFSVAREEFTDLGDGVVYDDFVMTKLIASQIAG
ncbi:MAG: hypothetical protein RLZ25_429 [Pseudomonadota bacterium]